MMDSTQTSRSPDHLLIRAAKGETVERPPVWAMRQAGRWDPEFNKVRGGLSFYEFSENVELAAQASLLPKRFGVDAIILFYDITTLAVAMGLPFSLKSGEGPVPEPAIRTLANVRGLDPNPDPERFAHIRQLLQNVREQLHGELPVLVFAGAPFTLASYCIGTGKDMSATRQFIAEQPDVWRELLDRISSATARFLSTLIRDGADAYQLFDSWAGSLAPAEYQAFAQAYHQKLFQELSAVPRILFVKECPYLSEMAQSGADVISLGVSHNLAHARRQYPNLVFQGNIDERVMRLGTPEQVIEATHQCLAAGGGQKHIVNLSHGMDRTAPVANFEAFVRTTKKWHAGRQSFS